MAISYKSNLHDSERLFVLAIDQYEDGLKKGVLYHGKGQEGFRVDGYLELVRRMEAFFQQMQFPRLIVDQRTFRGGKGNPVPDREERGLARRPGQAGTFTIRVNQRQNASWQGILQNPSTGEMHRFCSFLELLCCLDEEMCKPGSNEAETAKEGQGTLQQRVERYLQQVMKCNETMKILPDTLVYRFRGAGGNRTFMVRPMFYEHGTCQGVLYWKESKKQKNFRSFLELVGMMSDAVRQECDWAEQEEVV